MKQMTLKAWHEDVIVNNYSEGSDPDDYEKRDREIMGHEQTIARKAGLDVENDIIEVVDFETDYNEEIKSIQDHRWVLLADGWDDPVFVLWHNKKPIAAWYTSCRGMYCFDGYVVSEGTTYSAMGFSDGAQLEKSKHSVSFDYIRRLDPDNPYLVKDEEFEDDYEQPAVVDARMLEGERLAKAWKTSEMSINEVMALITTPELLAAFVCRAKSAGLMYTDVNQICEYIASRKQKVQ